MSSERNTLRKYEILRNGRLVNLLFSSDIPDDIVRHSFYHPPIRCRYIFTELENKDQSLQAMFIVPKRYFKKAIKRNKIRRRMKESYRLLKNELKHLAIENNASIAVHLSYSTNQEFSFIQIDNAIKAIVKEISNKLTSRTD